MPELARDPSEQCSISEVRGLAADAPARRCLNRRRSLLAGGVCEGPHRFSVEEPRCGIVDSEFAVEPELARDPSEQCTAWDQDRHHRCLNKATHDLETYPPQPICDGPHRFAPASELARDPSEQCIVNDDYQNRCLNKATLVMADGFPPRHCAGPHRFTAERPFAAKLGGVTIEEIRKQTRKTRQRYAMAWAKAAFGAEQSTSLPQRALRLLEEAVELYQASVHTVGADAARARAHELVDFVFERPPGEIGQELGGISVCMLVYAEAADLDVDDMEAKELHRVLNKPIEEFTRRNAAKNAAGFLATPAPVVQGHERCKLVMNGTQCLNRAVEGGGYCAPPHRFTALVEPPSPSHGKSRDLTAHFQRLASERYDELAKIRVLVGGEQLGYVVNDESHDPSALQLVGRLVAAFRAAHTTAEDYKKLLGQAQEKYDQLLEAETNRRDARITQVTEEEYQLFDAVRGIAAALDAGTDHRVQQEELVRAALRWVDSRSQFDTRTPTEIANGVTDLMPTRARPRAAISSDNASKTPRTMHLRRLPSGGTGAEHGPDECLVCHRLAATFTASDMYTYERDLYGLDARRCDGAWYHPPAYQSDGPKRFAECLTCRSCQLNRDTIAWYQRALHAADVREMEARKAAADAPEPVPMIMQCPACHVRHVERELANKPHHTHACQACGFTWRPAVVPTAGVQFLPGFKDKEA